MRVNTKCLIFFLFLFFATKFTHGQKEAANWLLTKDTGVNFQNDSISTFNYNTPLIAADFNDNIRSQASISDSLGNLLFYYRRGKVYNSNHVLMSNGILFSDQFFNIHESIIIPHPSNNDLYYIFYPKRTVSQNASDLYYSVVDMSLNNGLGDVTVDKHIFLLNNYSYDLEAVFHENGNDVFLFAANTFNFELNIFIIDSTGLNFLPIHVVQMPTNVNTQLIGDPRISISPNGKKLAYSNQQTTGVTSSGLQGLSSNFYLYDFDSNTGDISNETQVFDALVNIWYFAGEMEFSANSKYLYIYGQFGANTPNPTRILQLDLNANGSNAIRNSLSVIGGLSGPLYSSSRARMQLGIDGKLYYYVYGLNGTSTAAVNRWTHSLYAIENSNSSARTSQVINKCIALGSEKPLGRIPNFIKSYFKRNFTYESVCEGELTQFTACLPDQFDTFLWSFGTRETSNLENPTLQMTGNTEITVRLEASSSATGEVYIESQIIRSNNNLVANQINNYILCDEQNDGVELIDLTTRVGPLVQGNINQNFLVTFYASRENLENGIFISNPRAFTNNSIPQEIFVEVSPACGSDCIASSSFFIDLIEYPIIDLEPLYYLCDSSSLTLELTEGYDSYNWSTGDQTSAINISDPGEYSVTVINEEDGVRCLETFDFEVISLLSTVSVEVSDFTLNNNSIEVILDGDQEFEYSIDGLQYQRSNIFTNLPIDQYIVYARDLDGCSTITIDVAMLYYPRFFTPNGDSYNDYWQIINGNFESNSTINIFDRYGKFLTSFMSDSIGWDGTVNGNPVPSNDYWFVFNREDGTVFKSHFSLKR